MTERLTLLIDAISKGAASEFDSLGHAADGTTKKVDDLEKKSGSLSSTITKVGATSMAAGLAMGTALLGTVKAFEKSEAAAEKLDTAVSGMGSKIDTGAIKKLAFQLQQVSTVTDNQVVAAARWGAVYGLTTKQLEELLRAAVDLSAQTGQSVDATTKALARAAAGGSDKVLTKWGLQLDETARKADAYGTTVAAAMAFAGGAAAKHADTMSGQFTRLANNWTDVKEQIGAGANEVFEPLARGAANLSEKVASANPELLKTIGHFAALGSAGATVFGGLATIGGQLANIREGFAGASTVIDKFGLSLTKTGTDGAKSMTGLGKAVAGLGVVAAGVALFETLAAGINSVNNVAGKTASALDDVAIAAAKADTKGVGKGFAELAQNEKDTLRASKAWEQWGTSIQVSMSKAAKGGKDTNQAFLDQQVTIEDAQRALDKMDPKNALAALDALQKTTDAITGNSDQRKANQRFIDDNRSAIEKHAKAAKASADATEEQTVKTQDLSEVLKAGETNLTRWSEGLAGLAGAGKAAADGLDAIVITDDQIANASKMGQAVVDFRDGLGTLPHSIDQTKLALGGYSDEQVKSIDAMTALADQNKEYVSGLITTGASSDEVRLRAAALNSEYGKQLKAAGMTTDQTKEYQRILGLTPEQVETAIQLSGDEMAKFKLQLYANDLNKLPKSVDSAVRAAIDQGEYQKAWNTLNNYKQGVEVPVKPTVSQQAIAAAAAQIKAAVPPLLGGGHSVAPAPPPVGVTPYARTATPVGASVSNVTINLPPGTPTSRTLAELRRYRRGGGDMSGLVDAVVAVR